MSFEWICFEIFLVNYHQRHCYKIEIFTIHKIFNFIAHQSFQHCTTKEEKKSEQKCQKQKKGNLSEKNPVDI